MAAHSRLQEDINDRKYANLAHPRSWAPRPSRHVFFVFREQINLDEYLVRVFYS